MNQTNPDFSVNQRRDTYLKAATFFLPAAFFWMISVFFLFPLLQQLCQAAGTTSFNFDHAPMLLQAGGTVGQVMIFLTLHGYIVCAAVLLTLSLLEWRSSLWRRHRRAIISTGAVLFNFAVLLSITLMVVTALLAAPAATHHLKYIAMFNLESSITEWRQHMLSAGLQSSQLDELESHLREDISHQLQSGSNEFDAFNTAVRKMGRPQPLSIEFTKSGGFADWLGNTPDRRIDRTLALLWLVYCAGGFLFLGSMFLGLFYVSNFRLTLDFLFAILLEGIYLRGTIASIRLFGGIKQSQERFVIWLIALMDTIGGIIAITIRHFGLLTILFTILGIISIWLLRPMRKLRPA